MKATLTSQQIQQITEQYYSCLCDVDLSRVQSGVHFLCSPRREEPIKGFGCKYALVILEKDDVVVVSYAPSYRDFVEPFEKRPLSDLVSATEARFTVKTMHLLMFEREKVSDFGEARILTLSDYPLYENFFRTTHPGANPEGWLYDYFAEKVTKGYFAGYPKDGQLACVVDAPDMPFMNDVIQHTGITTLPEERRNGYAKCTAALAAHNLIQNGVCPQWECNANNEASLYLAKSVGYIEYAKVHIVEESL